MKVYGLNLESLQAIASELELELDNVRTRKNHVEFKLNPPHSRHKYARSSRGGRALKACSYEAFRDFLTLAFRRGAHKAQSAWGTWHSYEAFENDLPRLARINVGSQAYPAFMRDLSNETVAPV